MVVVLPMPRASVSAAMAAKPGDLCSVRKAKRKSWNRLSRKGRPRASIALPGLFEAPEVEERLAAGLLGAHAPSEVSFEGHLQVRTQLGVEVVIELCTAEEGAQTVEPLAKPGDHL